MTKSLNRGTYDKFVRDVNSIDITKLGVEKAEEEFNKIFSVFQDEIGIDQKKKLSLIDFYAIALPTRYIQDDDGVLRRPEAKPIQDLTLTEFYQQRRNNQPIYSKDFSIEYRKDDYVFNLDKFLVDEQSNLVIFTQFPTDGKSSSENYAGYATELLLDAASEARCPEGSVVTQSPNAFNQTIAGLAEYFERFDGRILTGQESTLTPSEKSLVIESLEKLRENHYRSMIIQGGSTECQTIAGEEVVSNVREPSFREDNTRVDNVAGEFFRPTKTVRYFKTLSKGLVLHEHFHNKLWGGHVQDSALFSQWPVIKLDNKTTENLDFSLIPASIMGRSVSNYASLEAKYSGDIGALDIGRIFAARCLSVMNNGTERYKIVRGCIEDFPEKPNHNAHKLFECKISPEIEAQKSNSTISSYHDQKPGSTISSRHQISPQDFEFWKQAFITEAPAIVAGVLGQKITEKLTVNEEVIAAAASLAENATRLIAIALYLNSAKAAMSSAIIPAITTGAKTIDAVASATGNNPPAAAITKFLSGIAEKYTPEILKKFTSFCHDNTTPALKIMAKQIVFISAMYALTEGITAANAQDPKDRPTFDDVLSKSFAMAAFSGMIRAAAVIIANQILPSPQRGQQAPEREDVEHGSGVEVSAEIVTGEASAVPSHMQTFEIEANGAGQAARNAATGPQQAIEISLTPQPANSPERPPLPRISKSVRKGMEGAVSALAAAGSKEGSQNQV